MDRLASRSTAVIRTAASFKTSFMRITSVFSRFERIRFFRLVTSVKMVRKTRDIALLLHFLRFSLVSFLPFGLL